MCNRFSLHIFLSNQDICTVKFESTVANSYEINGYYAVALTISDYPRAEISLGALDRKTPSDSLSSIPIQVGLASRILLKCQDSNTFLFKF